MELTQHYSGIRLRTIMIVSILTFALASIFAGCGASGASGAGKPGALANSGGCKTPSSVDMVLSDNIAGHLRYIFSFENEGSSPCTVKGYPTITLNTPNITLITTTSSDIWSNVAIAPVTLAPIVSGNLAPDNLADFAVQAYDQTTNCQLATPTITLPEDATGVVSSSFITVCGGKLYVSPVVPDREAFNQ